MKERSSSNNNNSSGTSSTGGAESNTTTSSKSSSTTTTAATTGDQPQQQNFLSPYDSINFMAPPIGATIKCVTCLGNTVQGKVIAYDNQTKMLALSTY